VDSFSDFWVDFQVLGWIGFGKRVHGYAVKMGFGMRVFVGRSCIGKEKYLKM
jgi:hypothetical protein